MGSSGLRAALATLKLLLPFWLPRLVALDLLAHFAIGCPGLVLLMRHGMPSQPSAYWQLGVEGLDFWQSFLDVFFTVCLFRLRFVFTKVG